MKNFKTLSTLVASLSVALALTAGVSAQACPGEGHGKKCERCAGKHGGKHAHSCNRKKGECKDCDKKAEAKAEPAQQQEAAPAKADAPAHG